MLTVDLHMAHREHTRVVLQDGSSGTFGHMPAARGLLQKTFKGGSEFHGLRATCESFLHEIWVCRTHAPMMQFRE